ncbi:MAG: cytoplasmic protein [Deltaproteobacteria bacterium]|nr:MAG: cytoplasmic protein [Deltaproteobacteria bacterium]
MRKIVLLAYNGEMMCFAHVMLYALDFEKKGHEVRLVIEGMATKLISELARPGTPFAKVYAQVREKGLIDSICRACSQKMGSLQEAERQGLNIVGDMQGHPSIERFLAGGYEIVSF